MLKNVSYNDKQIRHEITDLVGMPFSLKQRIKLRGIGSQRFIITSASPEISNLLALDMNLNYCNIELRQKGIIIRFRSLLETYAWVIPFWKLNMFKNGNAYSIYADGHKMITKPAYNVKANERFLRKIQNLKAQYFEQLQPNYLI
jgi:hypothetical protein